MRRDTFNRGRTTGQVLALLFVLGVALVGLVPRMFAAAGPECLVAIEREDDPTPLGDSFQCNECDQNCDDDGATTPNKACTFKLATCLNQSGTGCPLEIKGKKVKVKA